MSRLVDVVAGDLFYDFGWCRSIEMDFLGSRCPVKLVFYGDEDKPLDQGQRNAFAAFWKSRESLISSAEESILSHYQGIKSELIEKFSSDLIEEVAPSVGNKLEMGRLVQLESIFFPEDFVAEKRVFGLLANCTWDPGLGLAVRFENERVVDVGPQDILL